MRLFIQIILFVLFIFPSAAHGAELLEQQLNSLGIEEIQDELDDGTSFSDFVNGIFSGEISLAFEDLPDKFIDMAFGELRLQRELISQLILIVILSAILRQMSVSFSGKSVGEMGFYICYMVLVVILITSFYSISERVVSRVSQMCEVFAAMVPVFLTLLASGGHVTQATLMGPTIMGGSTLLALSIRNFVVPCILLAVAMELANNISERPMLTRFAMLFKQGITWMLKGAAMTFMLMLSLQRIGGGVINGLAARTARIVVRSIPVVGDVMGGAVETVGAVTTTLKSGTLVAAVLFLVVLCIPLIIKLMIVVSIFKLTAAVAEFICEERLVKCISATGEYAALFLGVIFLVEGMFIFSAILLLGSL